MFHYMYTLLHRLVRVNQIMRARIHVLERRSRRASAGRTRVSAVSGSTIRVFFPSCESGHVDGVDRVRRDLFGSGEVRPGAALEPLPLFVGTSNRWALYCGLAGSRGRNRIIWGRVSNLVRRP